MRFTTAATLSALLAVGGATASVIPRVLDDWQLAQPVEQREVPTLQCDGAPIHIGALKMFNSITGHETYAAFEGIRDENGYQMLDVTKAGQQARVENFAFTPCNSTFMGYTPDSNKAAEVTYGRLQPASLVGKRCVSADELALPAGRLIAAKCDPSDDSAQLLQFWSLTKQPAAESGKFTYYVNFLGKPMGDNADFPGSYTLSKANVGSNSLVRLEHHDDEGERSQFYLKMLSTPDS